MNGNGQSNQEALPMVAFDLDAVAWLTGLSVLQLQRWDRSGFFRPSLADPNRRRPGSRIYSRDDVVALAIIARLRTFGLPFAQITPVLHLLAPDDNGEWPERVFHVAGNRIVLSGDEAADVASQSNEPQVIDVEAVAAEIERAIGHRSERRPEEIGLVVRRRAVMRGVPIIAGTRVPTETIAWFHDNGYALDWILENFPRLKPEDIQAALAFEKNPDAANRELVLAQR